MHVKCLVRRLSKVAGVLGYVIQYGCVTHCVLEYVAGFVVCDGPSMEPTIVSENILITEHITPRLQRIRRGDIIIAKSPSNPHMYICKRVIALPGDSVIQEFKRTVVPLGHVWLEGDNHKNSTDSRNYGPVPQALIRGRAICKIWPLRDVKMLTEYSTDRWSIIK